MLMCLFHQCCAVSQAVTCLLVQWPKFSPRPVHMGFVVGRVALGQDFLWVLLLSLVSTIPPLLHTHSFSYVALATDSIFRWHTLRVTSSVLECGLIIFICQSSRTLDYHKFVHPVRLMFLLLFSFYI